MFDMEIEGCCRLCLAPKDECVEIWSNFGADKQKLEFKIQDCVHIKVSKDDHLSPMICHACISYLNSWQSFKNRCDVADRKQREISCGIVKSVCSTDRSHKEETRNPASEKFIKEEPFVVENDELDPSSFLMQAVGDGQVQNGFTNASDNEEDEGNNLIDNQMISTCTVCDMSFSNRANARRHERNIHGVHQNPAYSAQDPVEVTSENVKLYNRQSESTLNSSVSSRSVSNPLNDLRQRIRTKLRAHRETYDYKNPAKYRHLITPNKLSFIMRNLEFLQQLHGAMKCNCCNKNYPSYKYFMGHMRKKYQNLPRNVCFKCLKQFESKGQFIGHLKRKACINLYAIVMADDSIPKELPDDKSAETGEVICNKNYNQLPQQSDEFGYELFDREGNTSSSHLRNPQNCPVCDKQYNNYYNVLRHMESKHPNQLPQIYQCTRCSEGFPRQSELRDHLNSVHGETVAPVSSIQKILYSCRQCSNTYHSIDGLQEHIIEHNKYNKNEECNKLKYSNDESIHLEANDEITVNEQSGVSQTLNCGLCDFALTNIEALRQHMSEFHGMDKKFFYCNLCPAKFMNIRGLRFHLFRSHGVREESTSFTTNQSTNSLLNSIQQPHSVAQQVPSSNSEDNGCSTQTSKLNECKICHIVYKNSEQLTLHVQLVHPSMENKVSSDSLSPLQPPLLWFQCRYCTESFNARKKLTLHMNNSHEEVVAGDYSNTCTDCGGVYGSKKSLWVHRYKKHPKVSDPSPCDICTRVFFDKMELFHHTSQAHVDEVVEGMADAKKFTNSHEYNDMHSTSDALFSMLDTSAANVESDSANQSLKAEETVYQCEMCPKTFLILRNLQSHRGWHHRGPDGRKLRDFNDIWQPDQMPPSKLKRKQSASTTIHKTPPTCPHCLSTFASSNNLKRHIIEVHKLKPYANNSGIGTKKCDSVIITETLDANVQGESKSILNENESANLEQDCVKIEHNERDDCNGVIEENIFSEDVEENEITDDAYKQYFCELCQVYFNSANSLRQHVSEHIEGELPEVNFRKNSTDSISSTSSSGNNSTSDKEL